MPGGTAFDAESTDASIGTAAVWPRPPPPPPRPPAGAGAFSDGVLGSAPYFTSRRIASTSTAYEARQNGVVPSMFSSPQFALPQLLYEKYQYCCFTRAFGFAPAFSSADI